VYTVLDHRRRRAAKLARVDDELEPAHRPISLYRLSLRLTNCSRLV
jgi:hypothetical protein